MRPIKWLKAISDGRCFWDSVSTVVTKSGPDDTKQCALAVDDAGVERLVSRYGGSASNWRAQIERHKTDRFESADHFAIAPTSANLRVLLVIWDKASDRVWVYKPMHYVQIVLLKLEHQHFEPADPETCSLGTLEELVANSKETWEKDCPLLQGGGAKKGAQKTKVMGKADVALEAPATVQQWDECQAPLGDTWSVTFLNITSLRLHLDQVFALPSPIKVLVETRVRGVQYESICNRCQKQGYELVARESVQTDSDGHNGIFIMVKRPLVVRRVEHVAELEKWRLVARVEVVVVTLPSGWDVTLVAAYCYADDPTQRRAMHEDLVEFVAVDKNRRYLLLGDFNQDSGTIWPVELAKASGSLVDTVEEHSGPCPTTCVSGVPSSRIIDLALASEAMYPDVQRAFVEPDCSFGSHRPITLVCYQPQQERVERVVVPGALPPESHTPLPWEKEKGFWHLAGTAELYEAIQNGDSLRALEVWLQRWEALLVMRSEERGIEVPQSSMGRDNVRRRQTTRAERIQAEDPLPEGVHELKRVLAWCQECIQRGMQSGDDHDLSPESEFCDLVRAWEALNTSVDPPQTLGDMPMAYLALTKHFSDLLKLRRSWRVREWQSKLRDARQGQSTVAHAYVKARSIRAVHAVQDAAGRIITRTDELIATLRSYWAPIWWLDGDWEATRAAHRQCFEENYRHHIPKGEPLREELLSGADIRQAVYRLKVRTSSGMLGWTAKDWRALPEQSFQEFADVVNLCERVGWPHQMLEAWTALVPKEEQQDQQDQGTHVGQPGSLRPISVESTLLRVWSGARFLKTRDLLAERVAPCQYGMLKGKSTTDAVARAALSTSCDGRPWEMVLFDLSKCYDTLPTHVLSACLQHMGMSRESADGLQSHLSKIRRRFKLPLRVVSEPLLAGRGLVQGDALSVLAAQVLIAPLAWRLQNFMSEHGGQVVATAYQDDIMIASTDPGLMDQMVAMVEQFAKDFALDVNGEKTVVLDFAHGRVCGKSRWGYAYVPGAKYLGIYLHVSATQCEKAKEHTRAVVSKVLKRARRVESLPAGDKLKTHVLQSTALSPLHYLALGVQLTGEQERKVTGAAVNAVLGKESQRRRCSAEVLTSVVAKIHRCDITAARLCSLYQLWLRAVVCAEEDLAPAWRMACEKVARRPRVGLHWELVQQFRRAGASVHASGSVTVDGCDITLQVLEKQDPAKALHELRVFLRKGYLARLEQRRPRFSGLSELDTESTRAAYNAVEDPQSRGALRNVFSGGFCTEQDAFARCVRGVPDSSCKFCGHPAENVAHILFECPVWAEHRKFDCAAHAMSALCLNTGLLTSADVCVLGKGVNAFVRSSGKILAERACAAAAGCAPMHGIPKTRIRGKQPPPSWVVASTRTVGVVGGSSSSVLPSECDKPAAQAARTCAQHRLVECVHNESQGLKCLDCLRFRAWGARETFASVKCEPLKAPGPRVDLTMSRHRLVEHTNDRGVKCAKCLDCQRIRNWGARGSFASLDCVPVKARGPPAKPVEVRLASARAQIPEGFDVSEGAGPRALRVFCLSCLEHRQWRARVKFFTSHSC
eukprot:6466112-Amphidinium_carterae.2